MRIEGGGSYFTGLSLLAVFFSKVSQFRAVGRLAAGCPGIGIYRPQRYCCCAQPNLE